MMRTNIKYSTSSMKPIEILALAKNVVAKMTANDNFTTPMIALATITDKADEVEVAIEEATYGSKADRINRNTLVSELSEILRIQAGYVRSICIGDKAKLVSSGFKLSKTPEPAGIPSSPLIKESVMTGVTGQIKLQWSKTPGARLYQVWMTDSDPSINAKWTPVAATHRVKTMIDNLKSYQVYWFAISAIGAAGEGAKSDPAMGVAA